MTLELDGIMKSIDNYTEAVVAKGSYLYNSEVCEMRKLIRHTIAEFHDQGVDAGYDCGKKFERFNREI